MITPALFKIRFPEFDSVVDVRIQLFIEDAVLILNEAYWGVKYDLGLSYLTAHSLKLGVDSSIGNDEAATMLSGKSVDGTSVTFAAPTINDQSDAYYASSSYGQRYVQLRKNLGVPAYVI